MDYYVDSKTMKQIDYETINNIGIPSMVLMERAALKVVNNIIINEDKKKRVLVICGVGNNGGDGVCAARILKEKGYDTRVFVLGEIDKCSTETKAQINIAQNSRVDIEVINSVNIINWNEYDIIIDAIFGIGLTRNVEGLFYDVINEINESKAVVYSVDVPSGINTDNGNVMNIAVKSDYTITFGVNKKGLILHPGRVYAGKVIVEDIGFPRIVIESKNYPIKEGKSNVLKAFSKKNYKEFLPMRMPNSNKGSYGKVLIVAGSKNMAGACYFSAKSAYRMGAGLVQIFTCEDNREILQELVPEAIMTTYDTSDDSNKIIKLLQKSLTWCNTVVVGPGLGVSELSRKIVKCVISDCCKPKVIDADAINLISNGDICKISNAILTPHMKEMSRLMGNEVRDVQLMQYDILSIYDDVEDKYFEKSDSNISNIIVLKDATTLITDGNEIFVNTSGNNGLATGGSGDVLTGIIAGLLAQGKNNLEASALGVYLHGLCAEYYTDKASKYALNASDLIDSLQYIL